MSFLKKIPFRKIPGFRSWTPWKMAVGGTFYSLAAIVSLVALLMGDFGIGLLLLGLAALVAGFFGLVSNLIKKESARGFALVLAVALVLVIAGGTLMPSTDDFAADREALIEDEESQATEDERNIHAEADSFEVEGVPDSYEESVPGDKPDNEEERAPLSQGSLAVYFIDVGQGDAILIQAPAAAVLIDGGPRAAGRKVVEYLKQAGISGIDLVISTHPHEDHIGGLISVLKAFPVGEVIDPAVVHTTRTFEEYLTLIDEKDIKFTEGRAGMSRELGGAAVLEILHPASPSAKHLNNASIVVRLTYGEVSFLFTGDAEKEAEAEMLKRGLNLAGTVLKIGHHGSRTSSTAEFLKAVAPEVAVIMCGKDNLYGHPHEETLKKLADAGVEIYRTDLHGTIVVTTDGQAYDVNIERP